MYVPEHTQGLTHSVPWISEAEEIAEEKTNEEDE